MSNCGGFNQTLCWECAKATGRCSWSDEFIPVEGWNAKPTKKRVYGGGEFESYLVIECPEFERDAYNNGLKRMPKVEEPKPVNSNPYRAPSGR